MDANKLKSLNELAPILHAFKRRGRKIVLCHGCFDLVHYGHLKHFEAAKSQGDLLVVTVTPDCYIAKGPDRPFFTLEQRCEYLSALSMIDYVAANDSPSSADAIRLLSPDVYIKGVEYKFMPNDEKLKQEIDAVESVGGHIHYTEEIVYSSTKLIDEGLRRKNEELIT
ncbi:Uncharacterized protein SCG7109_AR_00170 [Chlamydiales bacterium SCGC AG-110-M15]|nr:Uncharacterized protein SCG7109_AR_00170 [Chlamydiales bacterium SCGC AG-110-M15]